MFALKGSSTWWRQGGKLYRLRFERHGKGAPGAAADASTTLPCLRNTHHGVISYCSERKGFWGKIQERPSWVVYVPSPNSGLPDGDPSPRPFQGGGLSTASLRVSSDGLLGSGWEGFPSSCRSSPGMAEPSRSSLIKKQRNAKLRQGKGKALLLSFGKRRPPRQGPPSLLRAREGSYSFRGKNQCIYGKSFLLLDATRTASRGKRWRGRKKECKFHPPNFI